MCVYLCVCVVHTCAKDATVRIADMFTAAMKSLQSSASTIHIVARLFFILHAPMSIHTHKIMQTYADSVPAPTPAHPPTPAHTHPHLLHKHTHTHTHTRIHTCTSASECEAWEPASGLKHARYTLHLWVSVSLCAECSLHAADVWIGVSYCRVLHAAIFLICVVHCILW